VCFRSKVFLMISYSLVLINNKLPYNISKRSFFFEKKKRFLTERKSDFPGYSSGLVVVFY